MIVGEQRKYLGAIMTLKVLIDNRTGLPTNELTIDAKNFLKKKLGLECSTVQEALSHE